MGERIGKVLWTLFVKFYERRVGEAETKRKSARMGSPTRAEMFNLGRSKRAVGQPLNVGFASIAAAVAADTELRYGSIQSRAQICSRVDRAGHYFRLFRRQHTRADAA
jgi:hypothetical protein